ncbi:MAG: hypothetical protein IJE55_01745 [Clostridia bacterium]|nr:hypothetical protein [Clostridia bacterium]MBQ6867397.1 hypothetical protein [Clostridia bacterium]
MKKIISALIALCMVFSALIPTALAVTTNAPSRVINLVYDDSSSMIETDGNWMDTWCQAKYSTEVFAGMLGENDTMNIYLMSDFNKNTNAGPFLTLNGADGMETNVSKVHNMLGPANNTPFNSVRKAYSDLTKAAADEKWLVVLTDGQFQGVDDIDAFFAAKSPDIRVMFLGMGPYADGIKADANNNIYFYKADTNKEILKNITDICTRVFNSDRLDVNSMSKTFSFDVPMGELVVFAQGSNVEINGVQGPDGTLYKSAINPVTVKYSEVPATNFPAGTGVVDKGLLGSIATFKEDFVAGDYKLDVKGAETIEIYYKPNVEIMAYLIDETGAEVTDLSALEQGEYTIEFGFVKGGTKEKVAASELLGDVTYEAHVTNNEVLHEQTYNSGDKISLEEGTLAIDVTARFLEYNTVSTHLDYSVFKNKAVDMKIGTDKSYTMTSEGLDSSEPIVIKSLIDNGDFTQEQWDAVEVPQLEVMGEYMFDNIALEVKKGDIGEFIITPVLDGKPQGVTYSDINFKLLFDHNTGAENWHGEMSHTIKLGDERSWIERNTELFIKLLIAGIILFILIGYLPFIKHYLPRGLKKKPHIQVDPLELGMESKKRQGLMEKNLLSTIIPYIPQTGTIKFLPKGVSGAAPLKVKGIAGRQMLITNIKAYAEKENITFDGEVIRKPEGKEKLIFKTSGSVTIVVEKNNWRYTCTPTQESYE